MLKRQRALVPCCGPLFFTAMRCQYCMCPEALGVLVLRMGLADPINTVACVLLLEAFIFGLVQHILPKNKKKRPILTILAPPALFVQRVKILVVITVGSVLSVLERPGTSRSRQISPSPSVLAVARRGDRTFESGKSSEATGAAVFVAALAAT